MAQVIRNNDFSLDDAQEALRDTFASFFTKECPTTRVRAAEPLGFDTQLWRRTVELGATSMGIPEQLGGDGAGLLDLVLVAEGYGSALAPVPFIEAAVAGRLLAAAGDHRSRPWLDELLAGRRILTVALHEMPAGERQLVPAGAVCDAVIALDGAALVLLADPDAPPPVPNQPCAPLAWWTTGGEHATRMVLAEGADARAHFRRAHREWKLLTAAALIGLADEVLGRAVEHAKTRDAFGVPIGSFQAVSHPLVDVLTGVESARRLIRKAAWFADHEPAEAARLVSMAWVYAAEVATEAVTVGLHVHGGIGFTMESDIQLFFRRAKGWATIAGDPRRELQSLAAILIDQGGR
ncbi:acyl-CoA dehydrogenase family protein [Nocardia jinanensis]|uniref:Acyl-CoA dehydrogenase n=1 Tax=Nocardia jinanensis TaxID=382504 RepID=A0A917RMN4_9NOCA|nr:acyl-CoA dehydrogenase [Nocardia jinanensis]GGL14889.1 acyl-CoA dehydrogenase [Nocardia jinanensis]